jgi:hypothetical protein
MNSAGALCDTRLAACGCPRTPRSPVGLLGRLDRRGPDGFEEQARPHHRFRVLRMVLAIRDVPSLGPRCRFYLTHLA